MRSLQILDGDIAVDSRGKIQFTSGSTKVSNQVNYVLSTSPYIQNLFHSNGQQRSSSNETAIRDAILKTLQALINQHASLNLPADETLIGIQSLQILTVSKTDFKFVVKLITKAGSFSLQYNRG